MLYEMLRLPLAGLLTAFYRRIHFSGIENFPKKGAVIVASNHSTACVEQMLIATFQRRGVYFWARANVFPKEKGLVSWLFNQGHLVPIHRPQEGLKNMSKNKDTFDLSQNLLLEDKVLYIAAEGNCVLEKRLRELKTGTARIAFQTAAATGFDRDVFVVPTGVNYTHHTQFRSEVMVSFGAPISVLKYKDLYLSSPQEAFRLFNEALAAAIRQQMVFIDHKADEPLAEGMLTIFRNETSQTATFPIFTRQRHRLAIEQLVVETINNMKEADKAAFASRQQAYEATLSANGLQDSAVSGKRRRNKIRGLGLALSSPLAAIGLVAGWLPMNAARFLRRRWVHDMQFWAPVGMLAAGLTWSVYGIMLSILAVFALGWWGLLVAPAAALLQYAALPFGEAAAIWRANIRYARWKKAHSLDAQVLENQRKALIQTIKNNAGEREASWEEVLIA